MNGENVVDLNIEEALAMQKGLDEDACRMQDAIMS
jgi:hypothetical protein